MTLLSKASRLIPDFQSGLMDFFHDDRDWNKGWISKVPAANITEDEDSFKLELAVPGLKKDDFSIDVDQGQLKISGTTQDQSETKEDHYTRREFSYESFSRSFVLPDMVEADMINANYQDGVLKLVLPKKEQENQTPKKLIKVQ